MSFVTAAKDAMDEYFKNNPPDKKSSSKPLPEMRSADDVWRERTSNSLSDDTKKDLEILAEARKAEQIFSPDSNYNWRDNPNDWRVQLGNAAHMVYDNVSDAVGDVVSGLGSGLASSQTGSTAKSVVYSDWTPAANYFGMDQDTAYAEHMVNTAHQREVADLKAAGLNPVLGISGSGSSGVAGSIASGASSAQKGLSSDVLVDLIGATASVVTMLVSKNPSLGLAVGKVAQAGGNLLLDD